MEVTTFHWARLKIIINDELINPFKQEKLKDKKAVFKAIPPTIFLNMVTGFSADNVTKPVACMVS